MRPSVTIMVPVRTIPVTVFTPTLVVTAAPLLQVSGGISMFLQ